MSTNEMFQPAPADAPPERIPFLVTSSGIDSSPGPAAYCKQSDALSGVPKLHLHGKVQPKEDVNSAPYRNLGTCIGSGRKYTIKGRYEESTMSTPGCDYAPEAFGKSGKAVYVHTKPTEKLPEQTPGPSDYQTSKPLGSNVPKYTFHGPKGDRLYRSIQNTPGPADYDQRTPSNSPRVHIGNKYEKKSIEVTPGPGSYNDKRGAMSPNKLKGVIYQKTNTNSGQTISPGPADYSSQSPILKNVPRLFMHGRFEEKRDINTAGYADTRGLLSNGEKNAASSSTKKYSLRSRHDTQSAFNTPGVDYCPPAFGSSSIKCSISPRYNNNDNKDVTPGPASYSTNTVFGSEARKSVFHAGRTANRSSDIMTPGPADYDTRIRSRSPGITIKSGKYEKKRDPTGEYVNLGSTLKGPRYSLGTRPSLGCAYS